MSILGREDLAKFSVDELALRVGNVEELYNLADNTEGWTDEKAIGILKDVIDNKYVYTQEQYDTMITDIKEYHDPSLDLGDINDPMPLDLIDTPFGKIPKDYPTEPDFNTVEDKLDYLYGGSNDE